MPSYSPVWNYRNRVNIAERYMVHICIYLNRKRDYHPINTPLNISKSEWTGKVNAWIKNTHPYAYQINEEIKRTLNVLTELNKRYMSSNKRLTFPLIFKELHKNNNTDSFNKFFEDIIKDPPEYLDDETMKRYHSALFNLNKYNPDIKFADLSEELFQGFHKWCLTKAELASSTVNAYFNACKKVVTWARKDHQISKDHQQSIFEDIHIKVGKPKKDSLEIEEITLWKNHAFTPQEKTQERDRDIFLFQIYTGYYYNDVKELLKSDLKKDPEYGYYLKSGRYKNDNLAIVPLWKFKNAVTILEKYRCRDADLPYLFPRDILTEDQAYNRNLKRVAKLLKWKRNIYNKLARNTNTQLYIRYGALRPIVSRMLGHEREETTSAYYEVSLKDIIEGTKNVDFEKLGI
jgi:integrase